VTAATLAWCARENYHSRMDRHWFLTNTCYGNWLPGDPRGFVGRVWEHRPGDPDESPRVVHNIPGTPCDEDICGLEERSRALLRGPPVTLTTEHADVLLGQFRETAGVRQWELLAVAIMFNHFHIVVGVPGDPDPSKVLGDFKSWGTRALSQRFEQPPSKTWWTERGSKRKLADERAVAAVVHYVLYQQPRPLLTWSPATGLHYGAPPR
jgi:REP element-mobilizing transposase RayT